MVRYIRKSREVRRGRDKRDSKVSVTAGVKIKYRATERGERVMQGKESR